ncbi:recombinase family protein [Mesorhizobium sp. M0977]|uniref:recombinase family protein n=1 Tax=Mesorhizobium sp. M0977 TaxID=2957039 RepID=UPI00333AA3CA
MIENPIYGGAYAYGKSRVATGYDAAGVIRPRSRRKARAEWLALIPDVHEGYVSWERAEAIRKMVSDNVPTAGITERPSMATLCSPALSLPALRPQADGPLHGNQAQHFRAIPAGVVCLTMASRVASPSVDYASTTLFCGLSSRER